MTPLLTNPEYYTAAEAAALIGKRVTTTVDYSAVPKGTKGVITRGDKKDNACIGVSWIRPGLFPLTDWFSKVDAQFGLTIEADATSAEWDATGTLTAGDDQRKLLLRGPTRRCRRCNRGLRNPDAIRKGIGKICERKEKTIP